MRRFPLLLAATAIAGSALATETITYSYDARGRLVQASHAGSMNNGVSTAYTIDPADNRTNITVTGAGSLTPRLSVLGASGVEGSNLSFTITRSGSLSEAVSVSYATANGSAVAPGDYTSASGTVSFTSGETSKSVSVSTVDDSNVESTESFTLALSSPTGGATIVIASAAGTITDNDTNSAPSFAIGNASATEGAALVFTVTRTGTSSGSYSMSYATAGSTATSGSDFTAASGTLTFASGETSKTISVSTIDDSSVESAETMTVTLSGPSGGATISQATGTGTINDNDEEGGGGHGGGGDPCPTCR